MIWNRQQKNVTRLARRATLAQAEAARTRSSLRRGVRDALSTPAALSLAFATGAAGGVAVTSQSFPQQLKWLRLAGSLAVSVRALMDSGSRADSRHHDAETTRAAAIENSGAA